MGKKLLILCIFTLFVSPYAAAQSYAGKEFWLALLDIDACTPLPFPMGTTKYPIYWYDTTELYLTSKYNATVIVHIEQGKYGDNGIEVEYRDTFYLSPGVTQYILLPKQIMCRYPYSNEVVNNGIHVMADTPIYVQSVNRFKKIKGVTAILPVNSIPFAPEYVITTNEATQFNPCFQSMGWAPSTCSEFVIVGLAPVSVFELFSNSGSLSHVTKPYKPITLTLRQGETFFYVGTAAGNNKIDLSGTIIRSKTPQSKFAVFAGNKRTGSTLKNKNNLSCSNTIDHTYEQLLPTVSWGKSYSALPFKNNAGGYYLKIIASEPNTSVWIGGNYFTTLNPGQHFTYNVNSDTANKISSNRPVSVMQFTKAATCNEYTAPRVKHGNISMIQLHDDENTGKEAIVHYTTKLRNTWGNAGAVNAPEAYVNVLTKTADTSLFTFDDKKIPVSFWKQSSQLPAFSYAQIYIDSTAHRLNSSTGFISYTSVFGPGEGGAYTSGGSVKKLHNNFIFGIQCKNDTTDYTALLTDSFSNVSWKVGNDPILLYGNKVRYVNKDTGYLVVTMYSKHVRTGIIDSIQKRTYITIADHSPVLCGDTLICGKLGFILAARYLDYYKSYLWNGGHPYYAQYIKNPGLYWIKVTERSGCYYTDTAIISNTPNPLANYAVSDTNICSNTNYPLRFANLSTSAVDPIINTHWDFDDFNPIDTGLDTMYHFFPKVGQYLVKMRVTTDKGCYDDTFAVAEVLQGPKADFSVNVKDSCLNSNKVTLTNLSKIDSANHMRFKWYFTEGYVISNSDPAQDWTYDTGGLFGIQLIYENTNGCIDTMQKFVRIYDNPKAKISVPLSTCFGDSIRFTNASSSAYTPISSLWKFGDNTGSSLKNPVHTYAKKGIYKVELQTVNPQGCADSAIQTIAFNSTVSANFTISDSIQCSKGNSFLFKNLSQTDTGNIDESKWSFGDGNSDTAFNPLAYTYSNTGKMKVLLTVKNRLGCSDSMLRNVLVLKSPNALISVNDPRQCEGDQDFDFTANTDINDSLVSFKWIYPDDSVLMQKQLSNIQFKNSGTFTVRFAMRSANACENEIVKQVSVNPKPDVAAFTPSKYQCFDKNKFNFFDQSNIQSGTIQTYSWDFGDGSNSNQKNPLKSYTQNGLYKVLLTCISDSGCSDTGSLYVSVSSNPIVNIQTIKPVCFKDSTVFNVSATVPGGTIDYYEWIFGDMQSGIFKSGKHAYSAPGVYAVKLITRTNGNCIDTAIANPSAIVLRLPDVNFRYAFTEQGSNSTGVKFTNLISNYSKLAWDFYAFGTSNKNDTTLTFNDSSTFSAKLTITDHNGCSNSEEKQIFVTTPLIVFTPNAFTPNGDGHNEGFGPEGIDYATDYTFTVFNRWGEIVYKSISPGEKWDGTYKGELCPNGVYIYIVELRDFFGRYKTMKGTVLMKW